jgi:DUF4097 and DUF4098 domain-containing protein YvlB
MQKTFETPGKVRVEVDNAVGLVVITARETASTNVLLEADSDGAEELVERATVESQPSGGLHVVRVKVPHKHGMKFVRRNGVTVRIDMPLEGDVDVATASADVELNGSVGEATVKTASGRITADDASGDLRVKTASGDISVGKIGGSVHMHSASGDVRAVQVDGRAELATTSGDIEVGSAANRADVRSTSGDICLGDVVGDTTIIGVSGDVRVLSFAAGSIQIRAVSGDIQVGVAKGVTLSVDAETMSGTVHSEIPLGDAPLGSDGGGPEVAIRARSVSGDVLVERAAGPHIP